MSYKAVDPSYRPDRGTGGDVSKNEELHPVADHTNQDLLDQCGPFESDKAYEDLKTDGNPIV